MTTNPRLRVAFQGELGAEAEDAIHMLFGSTGVPMPCASYLDAAQSVASGAADRAVLPIENTLVGSEALAHEAIDRTTTVHAVAETVIDVHHCLLAPPGASLNSIATVLSHSLALAQCQKFFREHSPM